MHIPDGLLDGRTCGATALVAAGGVTLACRRAGRGLAERDLPTAGLLVAFLLAAETLAVPVPVLGTDGHLMGGALATFLLGPFTAAVVLSTVVVLHVLVLGHGGVSAVGADIVNVALVPTLLAGPALWLTRPLVAGRRVAGSGGRGVPDDGRGSGGARGQGAAASGVVVGVVAAACVAAAAGALAGEIALGGVGPFPASVERAIVVAYLPIALVEGVVSALVARAVMARRPDVPWLTRPAGPARRATTPASPARRP